MGISNRSQYALKNDPASLCEQIDRVVFIAFAYFLTAFLVFLDSLLFAAALAFAFPGANSGISLVAFGDPSPVHASHPGPAEKAPLLPWVMSLNADAALAA
jgi:hypothetical protein